MHLKALKAEYRCTSMSDSLGVLLHNKKTGLLVGCVLAKDMPTNMKHDVKVTGIEAMRRKRIK